MTKKELRKRAEQFLALHHGPRLLVLPNAWDVISAKIFETEGFRAIATTSAGIAATLGYPDGERMTLEDNLAVIRRIAASVDVPVTADMEAGYARTPQGVARSARGALEAGAVGLNLEDGTGDKSAPLFDVRDQAEKIAAVRAIADTTEIPLVINARTDVYLANVGGPADRLAETVRRARAYLQAGADCIFVPDMGELDKPTIQRLVKEIDAPINIIPGAHSPPLAELEAMGVARVSLGPRPMRATLTLIRKMARELLDHGTYELMTRDAMGYAEVNAMLDRRKAK